MKNNVACCNFCLALEGLTNPLISGADLFGDYRYYYYFYIFRYIQYLCTLSGESGINMIRAV